MSNFNNKSITNKGLELLSAAMAGGKLEFTRIVMGSGTYSGDIGLIESLVSQKQSLDIKSITRKGSQVVLSTTLLQSAITEDFYWKEIGVCAKGTDNVEVLYMYGSATDTSFISKDMLNEKMINVGVLISNATNITATINNSLVYLSRTDLEEHDNKETAHKPIRDWVQGLFDSLKLTWDSITGKPSVFPPEEHSHSWDSVIGKPSAFTPSSHNHDDATTTISGFMSASDKTKLNDIAANANNYVHPGSGTNPHGTNKLDVGLGSVQNYGIATLAEAQAGTSNAKYMTPYLVKEACKMYGGDIVGKTMLFESITGGTTSNAGTLGTIKSYTNSKGGMVRIPPFEFDLNTSYYVSTGTYISTPTFLTVIVDGVTVFADVICSSLFGRAYGSNISYMPTALDIPFSNSIIIKCRKCLGSLPVASMSYSINLIYYINN